MKPGPNGKPVTVREEPRLVTPGDKLVFELSYRNGGAQPATGFVITDPIPPSVDLLPAATSAGAIFSVDGGRTWGPLAALRVATADGSGRPATAADVTTRPLDLPGRSRPGRGGKRQLPRRRRNSLVPRIGRRRGGCGARNEDKD